MKLELFAATAGHLGQPASRLAIRDEEKGPTASASGTLASPTTGFEGPGRLARLPLRHLTEERIGSNFVVDLRMKLDNPPLSVKDAPLARPVVSRSALHGEIEWPSE